MLEIDGSTGEGGGEIVRTAIAISLITGRPVHLHSIRAGRDAPGLRPQHRTALQAAAAISGGALEGDALGAESVTLEPGEPRVGEYAFEIGTAGSAVLVLRTLLLPLASRLDSGSSVEIRVTGGTHVLSAPPFEHLKYAYRPVLERMGVDLEFTLERHGFYPPGGGCIRARLSPRRDELDPPSSLRRGPLESMRATALLADLPDHIAERELETLRQRCDGGRLETRIRRIPTAPSPGNALWVEIRSEQTTEVVSAIGRRGVPAETIASRCADELEAYLAADAPVGRHLADQYPLLMAAAGGGDCHATHMTSHTETQLELVSRCFEVAFEIEEWNDGTWQFGL